MLLAVMRRDDAALELSNPFDVTPPGGAAARLRGEGGSCGGSTAGATTPSAPASLRGGGCGAAGNAIGGGDEGRAAAGVLDSTPAAGEDGGDTEPQRLCARLAAIDARLQEFAGSHVWDEAGSLADYQGVVPAAPSIAAAQEGPKASAPTSLKQLPSLHGSVGGASARSGSEPSGATAAAADADTHRGPRRVRASGGTAAGAASCAVSCGATSGGKVDYLTAARERKELEARWVWAV